MRRRDQLFRTIRSEGALLPVDLLQRIAEGDKELGGLLREDYHVTDLPLNEAIVRSWNRLVGAWMSFRDAEAALPEDDHATTVTRERWLLVLFDELSYGRLQTHKAVTIDGKEYPVSHSWEDVPIHLVGSRVPLDRRSRGVAGAAGKSPHGLVQELLNRSEERLWGFVSNGLVLRLLRDNSSLTRQAYLEFDLQEMMESEAYADFVVLWLTCHVSRLEAERPHERWLERWSHEAEKQGTRALDNLRDGVERAIEALGAGFLAHRANDVLRAKLKSGDLSPHDFYRELLRLVYRLLFLLAAEDRGLLHDPRAGEVEQERYDNYYSTRRLRQLAESRRGTAHADLYEGLKLVMRSLGDDEGCPQLGLPPLGSFLWSEAATSHLDPAGLPNGALLEALRALCFVEEQRMLRAVDYKNLGAEELGSVYESLLELHPVLEIDAGTFALTTVAGNERKATGSYYTAASLISCLLDSALDPVLDEAAAKGEEAILDLKVVDPACGSGHFLVAAAHRIAKRLASLRTADEEPSPEATRTALRDVVGRCLYGVDVNPMALELCKVSIWMEALEPGRPLSFLDAHLKGGNSLLGATLELIEGGIPDKAFKPIEGDDNEVARSLRKQNKTEREGQLALEDIAEGLVDALEMWAVELESPADNSVTAIKERERRFAALSASEAYERANLTADAWCAAFVQRMVDDAPRITSAVVRRLANGGDVTEAVRDEVRRLADEYEFFHWEIEFPQVFGRNAGGFDLVLGNPPWDTVELKEKEWFTARRPEIANARTAAIRKRMIADLALTEPALFDAWLADLRRENGERHFLANSGRYPLCGKGRINASSVFAEAARGIIASTGRLALILPLGIATDDTTKHFFGDLVESRSIASLYGFENEEFLFPGIDHRVTFGLLTLSGSDRPCDEAEFAFFCRQVSALSEPNRRFMLSREDFALLNPNTRTCPVFRTRRDAELSKTIHRRVPVLIDESRGEGGNPWELSFKQGLFNMASDSALFKTFEDLSKNGGQLIGNTFMANGGRFLPLYEAKMVHQFNQRFGTYEGQTEAQANQGKLPEQSDEMLADPESLPLPRYWVREDQVAVALGSQWPHSWLMGWRDICRNTDERTAIAAALPLAGVGGIHLCISNARPGSLMCLLATMNSFVFDYVVRQKVAGTHLAFFVMKQLPVVSPARLQERLEFVRGSFEQFANPLVLELTFTSADMNGLALDLGFDGGPFRWDPARRALLRAELDAAFFHLYGLAEEDVDYVMETFPIVKRRDEEKHGHYRTKALILEVYRKMAAAVATGVPYETILDPPPADPRVAHPPRAENASIEPATSVSA